MTSLMRTPVIRKYLLALAVLVCTPLLPGTSMVPMSVEALTRNAALIMQGAATRSWSQWNDQHSLIYTYTEFTVARTLKGQAPTKVVVKQLGGSVDGTTQHVSGVRYWPAGEEAVLFLRPSEAKDGTHVVVGLVQGNFRVRRLSSGEVRVSNGVPEVQWLNTTAEHSVLQSTPMTLHDLESRIQHAQRMSQ
ncbi:MAG TPA: hypothetical protein VFA71_14975 [Terriglobales bacterium]|nr:hypothetical protein [Terriglobales bacterium]